MTVIEKQTMDAVISLNRKTKDANQIDWEQRPQECKYCINNHCQHPYYNDCDCASWRWCDLFTPKTEKKCN